MKKYIIKISCLLVVLVYSHIVAFSQDNAALSGLDINKLMKMSPAELEKYKAEMIKKASKQAKDIAATNNFKIDETTLPDFKLKPPVKDIQRLALIPVKPPTQLELMDGIRQSKATLESVAPKALVAEVKNITDKQTADQLQSSSIGLWYADKPVEALLVSMSAVQKAPEKDIVWNNLAALFNMAGLEHKAVPVLKNLLEKNPRNSMVLNNLGQAMLGLGDLSQSENFFRQCLTIDPLHPEANRSMGMICLFKDLPDEAQQYFEKELQVAHRMSTLAEMKKRGKKIDLYKLREKRTGIPKKNFFEEINLGKFQLPDYPSTLTTVPASKVAHGSFGASISAEMLFWMNAGTPTMAQIKADGEKNHGLYFELVKVLLEDLHETYNHKLLYNFTDNDFEHLKDLTDQYYVKLSAIKCPQPPPGSSGPAVWDAYEKKCCDLKSPVMDAYITEYNGFVRQRIQAAIPRWKTYINALINIASLDPSMANQLMVYRTVSSYFSFLSFASGTAIYPDPPGSCKYNLTTSEADSIIESNRKFNFDCPAWLNIEYDVLIAKIKADCSTYTLEVGKGIKGSFEHNFKKGTSTIAGGVGMDVKFLRGIGDAGIKQMVYVSYDNNNTFSDFGLKGSAEVNIGDTPIEVVKGFSTVGGVLAGVEGGYTWGINSGFKTEVKGKGILADFIQVDKSLTQIEKGK